MSVRCHLLMRDLDQRVRLAAFNWLEEQLCLQSDDTLRYDLLFAGFLYLPEVSFVLELLRLRRADEYPLDDVGVHLACDELRECGRSRAALQVELLALRHQLHVLERSHGRRLRLSGFDRLLWAWLSRI